MLQTNRNIYDRARLWSQSLEAPGDKNMGKISEGLARIGIENKQTRTQQPQATTQMFCGRSLRHGWWSISRGNLIYIRCWIKMCPSVPPAIYPVLLFILSPVIKLYCNEWLLYPLPPRTRILEPSSMTYPTLDRWMINVCWTDRGS